MYKMKNIDLKRSILLPGVILFAILFLLNGISRNLFFRWDLTDTNMYSLSESSKAVIEQVDDLLTMKVYFSDNLPGEYGNNRRYLQDILEEYVAFGKGKIRFEFYRPEDDKSLEEEAQKAGIMPVQMQVVENDKLEVKRVLMGMVILFADQKEIIPVIQTSTGLEYEITTRIKKLVEVNKPVIGFAQIDSQDAGTQKVQSELRQRYAVRTVNLNKEIPSEIGVLLMSGVSDSLQSGEYTHLKSYLESGGNLFIAQSRVNPNLQTQQATVIQSNIFDLLDSFGLHLEENYVIDRLCGRVNVQQQMGPIRMNVPMEYPLLPIVRHFNESELLVSGLEQIQMIFASEIKQDTVLPENTKIFPLSYSSEQSGEMRGYFNLNPDPQQNPAIHLFNQSGKILVARSEKSHPGTGLVNQVVLAGDSDLFLDNSGGLSSENIIFVMNTVDYLIGEKDLIALRSRAVTSRPLDEVSESEKRTWKWVNILLPSMLIVGFGFIRLKQQNRKASVWEEIYD